MKRFLILLVILAAVLLMGTLAFAQDNGPDAIEIGASIPLSGRYGGPAAQVQRGYDYAIEAINDAGGVMVKEYDRQIPLHLTVLDDESDPVKAVSNLEQLYTDNNIVAYLGGFGSDMHAAEAAVAEKNAVPYIGVAFALWDIHQQGFKYLFSPFPKSPDLSKAMFALLDSIPEDQRPTKIGILRESTDWGIELDGFWTADAEAGGYDVVFDQEYAPGNQDFTDAILGMQDAGVQVLLTLPNPPDGLTLFTQMAELDFAPEVSLVIRAADGPTWAQNLGTVGDDVLLMPGWHHAMNYPGVDELNARHMKDFDRPADPIVGPAYASVQILAAAIESAGTLDRDAIRDAIAATDMDTVIGHVTFNEDGTGNVVTAILQYQNGVPELIWPDEFKTADFIYPAPPYADREAAANG